MTLKHKVFNLIDEKGKANPRWKKSLEAFIMALIALSIAAIILESFQNINEHYEQEFRLFEIFVITVFSIEYLLRVWTADLKYKELTGWKAPFKFIFSPMGLIDLIAILPFYLPFVFAFDLRFVRILRVARLLRIFKINRYTKALKLVATVFYEKRIEMGITFLVTFILLLFSSTIMYYIENEAQPDQFPNIIATFWWAVATLTTVGYGDVYPITGMGKLFSGIIALLGIGLVALPAGIISAGFVEKIDKRKEEKEKKAFLYCPHCGEKL